jgi:hypothetical protein
MTILLSGLRNPVTDQFNLQYDLPRAGLRLGNINNLRIAGSNDAKRLHESTSPHCGPLASMAAFPKIHARSFTESRLIKRLTISSQPAYEQATRQRSR